jgi:hypothetical protein
MPSADQVPINNPHSTMRGGRWVVLIAGSTGSALRAVRPPNLHITPGWPARSHSRRKCDRLLVALARPRPGDCARARDDVPRHPPRCGLRILRFAACRFLAVAIAHALAGSVFMFLSRRRFNDRNRIGRGKGFFQPDLQQLLKTVAIDVLVLVTLGSLSDESCFCFGHFQCSVSSPYGPARLTGFLAFAGCVRRRAEGDCEPRHARPPRSAVTRPSS